MRKRSLHAVMLIVVLASCAFAQESFPVVTGGGTEEFKFRDMPDSHWAAPSVYKLVNMGVTQGFPDGTFRGTKPLTRYETAVFLAKMADSLGYAAFDKMASELKSEIRAMKQPSPGSISFSGAFETRIMSSISGLKTTSFNYRLIASALSHMDNAGKVRVTLDTMDGGFYGGGEALLTRLIDVDSEFHANLGVPVLLRAAYGPGPQRHLSGASAFPSEYGRVYDRPYPGMSLSSRVYSLEGQIGYYAHMVDPSDPSAPGQVGVNRISGKISLPFDKIAVLNSGMLSFAGDYFYQNPNVSAPSATNLKPSVMLVSRPFANMRSSTQIKAGVFHDITQSRMAVIQDLDMTDLFSSGTDIGLNFTLAGSGYLVEPDVLDQWSFLGYDAFDRPAANGARRVSMRLKKTIADSLSLTGRGALDLSTSYKFGKGEPGSRLTLEGGLLFALGRDSDLAFSYRTEREPNAAVENSDLFSISLSGKF